MWLAACMAHIYNNQSISILHETHTHSLPMSQHQHRHRHCYPHTRIKVCNCSSVLNFHTRNSQFLTVIHTHTHTHSESRIYCQTNCFIKNQNRLVKRAHHNQDTNELFFLCFFLHSLTPILIALNHYSTLAQSFALSLYISDSFVRIADICATGTKSV